MPEMKLNEELVSKVEKAAEKKYGRDARQYAVDAWRIHIGLDKAPAGWKDPYARLDKTAKKSTAKKRTTAKKK